MTAATDWTFIKSSHTPIPEARVHLANKADAYGKGAI
eukprot:COSAG02_NODE_43772_length_372_cov_0.373626_1_plen_37_part_10